MQEHFLFCGEVRDGFGFVVCGEALDALAEVFAGFWRCFLCGFNAVIDDYFTRDRVLALFGAWFWIWVCHWRRHKFGLCKWGLFIGIGSGERGYRERLGFLWSFGFFGCWDLR